MARPLSDEKRQSLLAATARAVAEQGVTAPTAAIAKMAGVAEGSLFTYFDSKDALLSQTYLAIKLDLAAAMMSAYPVDAAAKVRARHAWTRYVFWSVEHPDRHAAMAQLGVSKRIDAEVRQLASASFAHIEALLQECTSENIANGPAFAAALLGALADVTVNCMLGEPTRAQSFCDDGFNAFWRAIADQ